MFIYKHSSVWCHNNPCLFNFRCSEGYEPDRRNPSLCVKPDKVIDCSCHPSGSVNRSCDINRNCYCKVGLVNDCNVFE